MTETQTINLSEDEFADRFSLVKNVFNPNAAYDGYAFETYGHELEFFLDQPRNTRWTVVEEDGQLFLLSGYHWVNRLFYLFTYEGVPDNVQYVVSLD